MGCGQAIKGVLETSEIYYCSLDDFCSGNIEEFKRAVLLGALKGRLSNLLTYNGKELARMLFEEARIEAAETDSAIEEIAESAFKKYLERNEDDAD